MKKENILELAKKEGNFMDEREHHEMAIGFGAGGIVVAILCFLFSIINALNGKRFYEFGIIIFAYLSTSSFYSYTKTKKKSFLLQSITCGVTVIIGFLGYFFVR